MSTKEILSDVDFYLKKGRKLYLLGDSIARNESDLIIDGNLSIDEIVLKIKEKI